MKDLFPFVQKSLDVIVLELELVQVGDVQEVEVFFTLLEPLKEEDKYLPSFELSAVPVNPFFFHN